MKLTTRVVLAHRPTEWEWLLDRHATPGQARFFLETRDQKPDDVIERHQLQHDAIAAVERSIPTEWRRAGVSRRDLPQFIFEPDDIVVAIGQDGLVPNLAKYLAGQPVIGVNPDPTQNEGSLVRFSTAQVPETLDSILQQTAKIEHRTMVEAQLDDGQRLIALNEIYIGHIGHQSSRYQLSVDSQTEHQSSSGIIVSTGTGASGWARSISEERHSTLHLPRPIDRSVAFFVREAWPSVSTGNELVEGILEAPHQITITSELNDGGVAFGDGLEHDRLQIGWGQTISVGVASELLNLVTL